MLIILEYAAVIMRLQSAKCHKPFYGKRIKTF